MTEMGAVFLGFFNSLLVFVFSIFSKGDVPHESVKSNNVHSPRRSYTVYSPPLIMYGRL